jgi:hypothetical protein
MDSPDQRFLIIAYTTSNIVALIMLWCSWKKPATARVLYLLLFIWASWTNVRGALYTNQFYLDYAKFTFIPLYKDFILGFFRHHITPFVFSIAVCQFFIGISMLLKGKIFQAGCWGGIIFLVSISPLGVGAAFPSTLVMAAGFYLLARKNGSHFLFQSSTKLQAS